MGRPSGAFAAALALLLVGEAPAHADVTVAIAAPLSGPRAAMGEDMRHAAEAAANGINAQGGVLGVRIALRVEDDGCDQKIAAAVAQALAGRAPALVVGHSCSGAAVAAAPIYAGAGLLFISPGARHPALTQGSAGKTIFRLAGRDDRQGEAAAYWLMRASKEKRLALVHDRTAYARAIADDTVRALRVEGVDGASVLPIVAGRKDYSELAARLKTERIEAMFFAGFPAEAGLILAALASHGAGLSFLGSDTLATPELGAVLANWPSPASVLLPHEPGAAGAASLSPSLPTLAIHTRAAIEVWAGAVRRVGTFAPNDVARALRSHAIHTGALGHVSFDDAGDARLPSFHAAYWNGQRWAPAEEFPGLPSSAAATRP